MGDGGQSWLVTGGCHYGSVNNVSDCVIIWLIREQNELPLSYLY